MLIRFHLLPSSWNPHLNDSAFMGTTVDLNAVISAIMELNQLADVEHANPFAAGHKFDIHLILQSASNLIQLVRGHADTVIGNNERDNSILLPNCQLNHSSAFQRFNPMNDRILNKRLDRQLRNPQLMHCRVITDLDLQPFVPTHFHNIDITLYLLQLLSHRHKTVFPLRLNTVAEQVGKANDHLSELILSFADMRPIQRIERVK
ncbi:hypothetical protein D3C77_288740 [compost metagenome]